MSEEELEQMLFKLMTDVSVETENYIESKGRLIRLPMKASTAPIMKAITKYSLTKHIARLEDFMSGFNKYGRDCVF